MSRSSSSSSLTGNPGNTNNVSNDAENVKPASFNVSGGLSTVAHSKPKAVSSSRTKKSSPKKVDKKTISPKALNTKEKKSANIQISFKQPSQKAVPGVIKSEFIAPSNASNDNVNHIATNCVTDDVSMLIDELNRSVGDDIQDTQEHGGDAQGEGGVTQVVKGEEGGAVKVNVQHEDQPIVVSTKQVQEEVPVADVAEYSAGKFVILD